MDIEGIANFTCLRCGACCGPHYVSEEEQKEIETYLAKAGLEKRLYLSMYDKCPYLDLVKDIYTCLIYPVRPLICRLMGVTESMPCSRSIAPGIKQPPEQS